MEPTTKVQIRTNSKKKRKAKHWWIRCPLCNVKSHVRQSHWETAIKIASDHIRGRQHQNKLALLEAQQRWQATFS